MKIFGILFMILILTGCQKSFDNPQDPSANVDWGPTDFYVTEKTPTKIVLEWTPISEYSFDGYFIDRKIGDNNWVEKIASLNNDAVNWTDSDVMDFIGKQIKYRIYAFVGNTISNNKELVVDFFDVPSINNPEIQSIEITSAKILTIVSDDGGSDIIERGFIYGKSPNLDINPKTIILENTLGVIESSVSDLDPYTIYYVKAFVKNQIDYSYSQIVSFKTLNGLVDNRDGQVYSALEIGDQIWMSTNLNYNIPNYSWEYIENSLNYSPIFGKYYSYEVLDQVCPEGWHLSTDEDWHQLETFLGMDEEELFVEGTRESGEIGRKLKSTTQYFWYYDGNNNVGISWMWSGGGDDEYSFTALPAGHHTGNINYPFTQQEMTTHFWCISNNDYYTRAFYSMENGIGRTKVIDLNEDIGMSVRCVKNSTK